MNMFKEKIADSLLDTVVNLSNNGNEIATTLLLSSMNEGYRDVLTLVANGEYPSSGTSIAIHVKALEMLNCGILKEVGSGVNKRLDFTSDTIKTIFNNCFNASLLVKKNIHAQLCEKNSFMAFSEKLVIRL